MINETINVLKAQIAEGTLEVVAERPKSEGYTAYAVATLLNEAYGELGIERTVRPQAMYNYAKAGRINGVKDAKVFSETEVQDFVTKMVMKDLVAKTTTNE